MGVERLYNIAAWVKRHYWYLQSFENVLVWWLSAWYIVILNLQLQL